MPAAPKASQTKKAGASKAKGAVRAKTGCYTCRIRRKKCDEQKTDRDTCRTCDRLRLECLGFGAKRPEWLRENRNVTVLRDKIKVFLASQGLIKGHSGSGPRSSDQEQAILRLSADHPNYHSSSSESPPARLLSLSSDEEHHRHHNTSSIRDQRQDPAWFNPGMDSPYGQSGLHPTHARSDSPFSNHSSYDDHHLAPYALPNSSSTSLVDPSSQFPALRSSFSPLYHDQIVDFEFSSLDLSTNNMNMNEDQDFTFFIPPQPTTYLPDDAIQASVRNYVIIVSEIQYLLGDRKMLPNMIWASYLNHDNSKAALTLLSSVYWKRQQQPNQAALGNSETNAQLYELQQQLEKGRFDDADDAMAALHTVSMFLFDGGHGAWHAFLKLATRYVDKILWNSSFGNPRDALLSCSPKDAFIVKTAIWFDVLASITTQEPPHFLYAIRAMFDPDYRGIHDEGFDNNPQCSMMSPMGCENRVVWALAEAANLAHWKQNELSKGRLSVFDLVSKAAEIDLHLQLLPHNEHMALSDDHEMERNRFLASEIFRCATRLFLASVVAGDFPHVKEIQFAVEETMKAFRALPLNGVDIIKVSRSVVRSTVFGIYLCGSLTNNKAHRDHLIHHLDRESGGGEGVGNCASIRKMLDEVWKQQTLSPTQPIPWRMILSQHEILLV